MDGFSCEVLSRLPLADAVLSLCSHAMDAEYLQQIYDGYRGRSYEGVLAFPTMVNIICDALLEHEGSGRQAMVRAQEREELEATKQAVYGKLRRIPISLSNGFLARTTDRLRDVFPQKAASRLPASLRHLDVVAIDGKKIKRAAKRLKVARGYSGTPLGGKALAALDLRTGLVVAMNAHLDGETNDAPLVPDLLPQVRQRLPNRRQETERCTPRPANSCAMSFARRSFSKKRLRPATRTSKATKMRLPVVSKPSKATSSPY